MQWQVIITLAGVDKSSQLSGEVMIDAEESSAAIAEFTLLPEPGPINPDQWIGAPVLINAVVDGGAPERIFTGNVDVPKYDIESGLTKFRCTDGLQKRFEEMSREEIDDVVAAYWSPYIFDDAADGWDYAQDQMSTDYYSVDADRFGVIDYFSLEGGQEPTITYDDSSYVAGSLGVDLPSHRDLVNQVDLHVECRYTVYVEAAASFGWSWPYNPGDAPGWPVPSPSAAQSAAASVGRLSSFSYQEFPSTGLFENGSWDPASSVDIANGSFVSWQNERPAETCFSFTATAKKRAAVEVTWKSHQRFRFEDSISRFGVCKKDETFAFDMTEPPPAGWDQFESDADFPAGWDARSSYSAFKPSMPVSFDPHVYRDIFWSLAYLYMVDVFKRHRARVRFAVPFEPLMDRRTFAGIGSSRVSATGKVYRYVHRLNAESGAAVTELTLAPNLCGSDAYVSVDEWWEEYPDALPVKPETFSASVAFESRDPTQSGNVGFQVDAESPDFSPFSFEYSDPIESVRVARLIAASDQLVIHGRSA